jgi:tRNA modification GTPase
LVDTAGLRRGTEDPIEVEGIRRTRDLLAGSDLVVAVADGTLGEQAAADLEEEELAVLESKSDRLIRVWNKADLAPDGPKGWIPVSAVTGFGFVDLEQAIRLRALGGAPPPEAGAPVIDSARQKDLMEVAVKAMDRFLGGTGSEGQTPIDLLSEDLYEALDALGELTGTVTRTDVLETLFGEFCVGK